MTKIQQSLFDALVKIHPAPWYLEQCNANGVEVKDARGGTVFYEDLGSIPDEMPAHLAESIREGARALALFLVQLAEPKTEN